MSSKIILNRFFISSIVIFFAVSLFSGCGNRNGKDQASVAKENSQPDTLSMLVKFDNSLFPLPSPFQAAALIKKKNIPFDESIACPTDNYQSLNTTFKKA